MKKKLLLAFASLLLIAGCSTTISSSEPVTPSNDVTNSSNSSLPQEDDGHIVGSKGLAYTLTDDETSYILTGLGTCKEENVVVGNYYKGKPVTTIAGAALSPEEGATGGPKSIIVSQGITTIEFRGLRCMTAEYIYLPESITTLSKAMFIRDSKLKTVVLPSGLTSIEDDAFMECKSIKDVYFRGSEAEWSNVKVSAVNNDLTKATIHYDYIE